MTKPVRDWERDWKLSESLTDWGNWYSVEDIAEHVRKINEAQAAMKYWLQRVKELEKVLRLAYRALTEGMADVPAEARDPQCARMRLEAKKAIRAIRKVLRG